MDDQIDLVAYINSQCIFVSNYLIFGSNDRWYYEMVDWLDKRAKKWYCIPFADAKRGYPYVLNFTDKWAVNDVKGGLIIWIADKCLRTEFVLTWL